MACFLLFEHGLAEFAFAIDNTAEMTFSRAAILGIFQLQGILPVFLKPFLGDHDVNVIPRQALVDIPLSELTRHIVVHIVDGLFPGPEIYMFFPGLQTGTIFPGGFDQIGTAPIRSREQPFDK